MCNLSTPKQSKFIKYKKVDSCLSNTTLDKLKVDSEREMTH